jgi:tight adherence protein B
VIGILLRAREREQSLAEILDLPFGERDVAIESVTESPGTLVQGTVGFANRVIAQFDAKGSLSQSLEKARIPLKAGEYAVVAACSSLVLAVLLRLVTGSVVFAAIGLLAGPMLASAYPKFKLRRRRRAFEAQLPDSLSLIASSIAAGHTFLRAIQMMCEESEPPLSEEFARVVYETRLGDPVVDALERMAIRLEIKDLVWVVQAIRIQQTVGGKLADLLHTLADFIRAREEVRREVSVLTAEGRISAYVLGALPVGLLFVMQVINPGYLQPLLHGGGLLVLAATGMSVLTGVAVILKMVKIEV